MSDPVLIRDPAIIEAAARARSKHNAGTDEYWEGYTDDLEPILAAVAPLIRADTLEEAARVADSRGVLSSNNPMGIVAREIAAAIRALKEIK